MTAKFHIQKLRAAPS